MDKTASRRLVRSGGATVGRSLDRVTDPRLDPARLDDLFVIGVDEIAWRKRHQYLTLVSDHRSRKIVWGAPGKDTATLDRFFDELGTERAVGIQAGLHGH